MRVRATRRTCRLLDDNTSHSCIPDSSSYRLGCGVAGVSRSALQGAQRRIGWHTVGYGVIQCGGNSGR